jgi:gamma-glutamyltranspeptidase / glutathione hydrolase
VVNLVVCPEVSAAKAGEDIFAQGGNAVDAAVAAAFVQGVETPLFCGIGGGISLYYRDGKSGQELYVKAESLTGSRPIPESWATEYVGEVPGHRVFLSSRANEIGHQSVAVPGFVLGCWVVFERFGSGRVSWAEALAPAIRLAREGVDLSPISLRAFEYVWARDEVDGGLPKLSATEASRLLYSRPDGSRLQLGDRLVQTELAATLERLGSAGAEDFYRGEIAAEISRDFSEHDGFITAEDLREFTVEEDAPLEGEYHGLRLASQPLSNGHYLIEALQILEHFNLVSLGHNSPEYIDLFAKVMRVCYADFCRLRGLDGDEKRQGENELIELDYAERWADRIKAGEPVYVEYGKVTTPPGHGTTALNAVDAEGTIVSINHSIGIGGSGVVTPGLGFLYNNDVQFYSPNPSDQRALRPRTRFPGNGSPLAIFDGDRPQLVVGAPCGSRIPTSILQSAVNVIDFGMDALTAVTLPRLHSEGARSILLEYSFREGVADRLRELGNTVERNRYHSRPQLVVWRPDLDSLEAGSDPRVGGAVGESPSYHWAKDFQRKMK